MFTFLKTKILINKMFGTVLIMGEAVLSLKSEAQGEPQFLQHSVLARVSFFPDNINRLESRWAEVRSLLEVEIYFQSPLTHIFHFVPLTLLTPFA